MTELGQAKETAPRHPTWVEGEETRAQGTSRPLPGLVILLLTLMTVLQDPHWSRRLGMA